MLNLEILCPNRTILDEKVDEIILPTESGQIGILPKHANLIASLESGLLQFRTNQTWRKIFSFDGIAEIEDNTVKVMILEAENIEDIDSAYAKQKLEESLEILEKAKTSRQKADAEKGVKIAQKRIRALEFIDANS